MTLRTLNYGNYGIFLIMGNAGFCPSAVVLMLVLVQILIQTRIRITNTSITLLCYAICNALLCQTMLYYADAILYHTRLYYAILDYTVLYSRILSYIYYNMARIENRREKSRDREL